MRFQEGRIVIEGNDLKVWSSEDTIKGWENHARIVINTYVLAQLSGQVYNDMSFIQNKIVFRLASIWEASMMCLLILLCTLWIYLDVKKNFRFICGCLFGGLKHCKKIIGGIPDDAGSGKEAWALGFYFVNPNLPFYIGSDAAEKLYFSRVKGPIYNTPNCHS